MVSERPKNTERRCASVLRLVHSPCLLYTSIDELSIAENLFVGRLPQRRLLGLPVVDFKYINKKAKEMMELVGLRRSPGTMVEDLPISEKQLVEIAKALVLNTKILIMDEPTSSLTIDETQNLFKIIRSLQEKGVGIIYI